MSKDIGKVTNNVRKLPFSAMVLVGLFTLPLTACSTSSFKIVCPQIVPWTAKFQHQVADEIRANPNLVVLPEIARQDVTLRDQVRACQSLFGNLWMSVSPGEIGAHGDED
ncbi:hypothetical protein, partial [Acetobacter persici]